MKRVVVSCSVEETHRLAAVMVDRVKEKKVVCLYGDLGSGKTTLVQGLARALGVKGNVQSPTFTLVREYPLVTSSQQPAASKKQDKDWKVATGNWQRLIHVDCYRVDSAKDLKGVSLQEYWEDPSNLVVIEWAERVKNVLPENRLDVCFEQVGENKRKITIF